MLDIDFRPTFSRPVTVLIPSGTGTIEQSFSATFEALDIPEFNGFDLGTEAGAKKFLERVFVGAEDVLDKTRDPVAWTIALRDRLIGLPWARKGLVRSYLSGFREDGQGN